MRQASHLDPSVPITPMLDMSFQLLSFFILTFKPVPAEGQLAVLGPGTEVGPVKNQADPVDAPPGEYAVVVYATPTGDVALMSLRAPTRMVSEITTNQGLLDELRALPPAGGAAITVEAAADLRYARLIEVLDLCKRAGWEVIHIAPLRPAHSS